MAIAALLPALSSIVSGVMGFASMSYQAKIAEMNADVARDNAKRAIERSQVNQQEQDDMTRALLGEQEAMQGASGLSLNSGSAKRTRRSAAMLGRKDALNVRQAGEIEKYNYLVQAANFDAQAGLDRMSGVGNLLTGFLSAGGSMIGRSRSVAPTYAPVPYPKPRVVI